MGRALKYLVRLAILAAVGLVAYALFAELPAPVHEVEVEMPVPPSAQAPAQPAAEPAPAQPAEPAGGGQAEEPPTGDMQE